MGFFSKDIMDLENNFFALDLSDLSVKVFQIEKNGKIDKIRSYFSQDMESGCIEDGRIINKEKVVSYIKSTIGKAGPKKIRTKKVVCSLPESKVFLRVVNIPLMEEKEVAEAIKWEIEASIPLTSDQVCFDWQILNKSEDKQEVLTVSVSKEVVDDIMEVLGLAGLEVYGLEVESIATVRSLIPEESSREDIFMIVDLGARGTSFIISEGNIPCFTSSIPFSSEGLTDAISKSFNIQPSEAEKIKLFHGIEKNSESNSVFNAVRSTLENLSVEIQKSLDFYQSMSKNSAEIKKIIMCGGGSNLKGLLPYLTTRISKEVLMGDPWVNLDFGNNLPVIDKDNSVRFTTAIGLALKKINKTIV